MLIRLFSWIFIQILLLGLVGGLLWSRQKVEKQSLSEHKPKRLLQDYEWPQGYFTMGGGDQVSRDTCAVVAAIAGKDAQKVEEHAGSFNTNRGCFIKHWTTYQQEFQITEVLYGQGKVETITIRYEGEDRGTSRQPIPTKIDLGSKTLLVFENGKAIDRAKSGNLFEVARLYRTLPDNSATRKAVLGALFSRLFP